MVFDYFFLGILLRIICLLDFVGFKKNGKFLQKKNGKGRKLTNKTDDGMGETTGQSEGVLKLVNLYHLDT